MTIPELRLQLSTDLSIPTEMLEQLLHYYQEPQRFYHTIYHV